MKKALKNFWGICKKFLIILVLFFIYAIIFVIGELHLTALAIRKIFDFVFIKSYSVLEVITDAAHKILYRSFGYPSIDDEE